MKKSINGFTKKERKKYPGLCNILDGLSGDKHDRELTLAILEQLSQELEKKTSDLYITIPTSFLDEVLDELDEKTEELGIHKRLTDYYLSRSRMGFCMVSPMAAYYQSFIRSLPVGATKISFNEWELPEDKKTIKKATEKNIAPVKRGPGRQKKDI